MEKAKEHIVVLPDPTPVYGPTNPTPEQKESMRVKRCQIQLPGRQPGANWSDMKMVFFAP